MTLLLRRPIGPIRSQRLSAKQDHRRILSATLLVTFLLGTAPAFASPEQFSSGLLARCSYLFDLWARYEHDYVFSHPGDKAIAELAVFRCQQGDYEENTVTLEGLLRNGRFPAPESLGQDLVQPKSVGQRP